MGYTISGSGNGAHVTVNPDIDIKSSDNSVDVSSALENDKKTYDLKVVQSNPVTVTSPDNTVEVTPVETDGVTDFQLSIAEALSYKKDITEVSGLRTNGLSAHYFSKSVIETSDEKKYIPLVTLKSKNINSKASVYFQILGREDIVNYDYYADVQFVAGTSNFGRMVLTDYYSRNNQTNQFDVDSLCWRKRAATQEEESLGYTGVYDIYRELVSGSSHYDFWLVNVIAEDMPSYSVPFYYTTLPPKAGETKITTALTAAEIGGTLKKVEDGRIEYSVTSESSLLQVTRTKNNLGKTDHALSLLPGESGQCLITEIDPETQEPKAVWGSYGSVEMASSTADVLKEKSLYFIPNNNAYDGYVRHISNITTTQIEHTAHLAESGAPYYRGVQKLGTYIYAVGDVQDGGTINRYAELLRSSDYGATWESTLVPLNGDIGFYILNNLLIVTGVGSDNNRHLYTSSDYGDTWGEKQMPSNSSIHPIEYYNGNYYCIINGNVICKSPDLVTWESSTLPANPNSWGMTVFKGLLIAMSSGNYCCWTEDGVTWHKETFEVQSGGFGPWGFVTDGNIIICKSYYCWLTSYDGKHWTAHNPNNPAPGTTEPFLSAVLHDGKKWIVKKAFIQDAQEPSYVAKWFVGIDFDNLEEVISFPPRSAANYNQLISVGNKILAIDSDLVSAVDFNTSKIFEVNITYFEKVIEGASLKNHIDNKVMHLNTITIPTGNNGTAKCFKIMSIDDCSNFSNFTLLSNYVNDIGMVSNMSIDMIGIYDDSYGHKVFEHHVLGTSQVYCNKRTHMEEEQEILDGVDVYLYTTFFQNSNIVVTLLQGQNLLTDDITFGNLGTEELSNLQNVVSKKMDILPIDSVKGLQGELDTLAAPRYSIVTQLPKMVDAVANHTYYVKEDGIMCGYLKKNASWVEGEPQDHIVSQNGGEWQSIVYGKGVYVAIRNSEAIGYSYDGIAWYRAHILPGSSFYTIAYGNGMFVACSTSEYVAYSYDGINWFYSDSNTGNTPIDSPQIVKFFNDRFFIVSGAELDKVAYSLDGITWTQVTLPSARWWADAAFGNGTYVVIHHEGYLAYSSDLVNWTEIQLPSTSVDWTHVDFVPWLGKFIATAKAANFIAISSDGITWEQVSLPITTNLDWSKVVYNDYKIIMKANQSTKGLMSENGTSWTEFNVPSAMEYRDLVYGNGKFVIMGGTTVLQPVYLEEYVCISNS